MGRDMSVPARFARVPARPADEFAAGARQCLVRLAGDGRPFRMAGARPPVPLPVQVGEAVARFGEPFGRHRAGRRQIDVQDPGECLLVGEELQEREEPCAQHFAGDASMNSRRGTPRGKQNTVNLRRVMGADDHGVLFTANSLNGGLAVPWPH